MGTRLAARLEAQHEATDRRARLTLREAGDWCYACHDSHLAADARDRATGGDGLDRAEWRDGHAMDCLSLRAEVAND